MSVVCDVLSWDIHLVLRPLRNSHQNHRNWVYNKGITSESGTYENIFKMYFYKSILDESNGPR